MFLTMTAGYPSPLTCTITVPPREPATPSGSLGPDRRGGKCDRNGADDRRADRPLGLPAVDQLTQESGTPVNARQALRPACPRACRPAESARAWRSPTHTRLLAPILNVYDRYLMRIQVV